MESKSLFVLTCCLVVCVNCAKKSRVEQKVNALDNLFRGEMYLVNEKLETGRQEREMLLEKFNETLEYLEKLDTGEEKTLPNTNTEGRQSHSDTLLDEIEVLSDKVEQNDRDTDEMSETLIRMKRGVQEEKVARKSDANAVIEQLLEIQKKQNEMKESQNEMMKNINSLISNQNNLSNKLLKLEKHSTEVSNFNDKIDTQLVEVVGIAQNLESNIDTIAQQVQDVKEDVAPKLYCKNQLGLDACLENHFTEQQQLLYAIKQMNLPVRLVDGRTKYEGRVEINYEGRQGTVCDDLWDDREAKVVCRMLGYTGGTAFHGPRETGGHSFGKGIGEILLDDVECTGSEDSLFQCQHPGIGVEDCSHNEDAGVICQPWSDIHLSRFMTKPTKWLCAQQRLRSTWASAQSDQDSSLCAQWIAKDPSFLHVDSKDSDQTGRMPRLIWVFAGCTYHFVGFVKRWLICDIDLQYNLSEPEHNKTKTMTCLLSEDPDQPRCLPSLIRVFLMHFMGS